MCPKTPCPGSSPFPDGPAATFNDRVREFWDWFQQTSPTLRAAIRDQDGDELNRLTIEKVSRLFPGFAWVYGPGQDESGLSFTLSGEGIEHKQLLALHWLEMAPQIDGWHFHASRQAATRAGGIVTLDGHEFQAKEFWVTPEVDEDKEQVNLTIWHPLWPELDLRQKHAITFIFLDEALGEYGTGWWTGTIRLENDRLEGAFPIWELHDFISEVSREYGWEKYLPGEACSLFKIEPEDENFPRSDLFTLLTVAPNLFEEHREAKGDLPDPLVDTGATYLYVAYDSGYAPAGEELETRCEIEEALDAALKAESSGRCIGGGMGLRRTYVDLLIYDGERSMEIIRETLRALGLPGDTALEFFASQAA